ncbi:hypothetical protein GBA52_028470 [Prunus armeniaca]|nr:hypothetical protein GBA52_028470 [Prunus armeniaca]
MDGDRMAFEGGGSGSCGDSHGVPRVLPFSMPCGIVILHLPPPISLQELQIRRFICSLFLPIELDSVNFHSSRGL